MTSRLNWPTLGRRRESSFTEDLDARIRQGHAGPEVVDYIFPSKQRYQHFKGEGSWLKVVMAHPGAAMTKSSTKWDNIRTMSKWGWTNTVFTTTFYANIDGIGDLVGDTEGSEYQWVHSFEAWFEGPPTPIRYPVSIYQ
jgi:hypothetical protein